MSIDWKYLKANLKVWWESKKFKIKIVRREDAFGKTYRYCYKKYGHKIMLDEYLNENTWRL